ncbi:MAG: hypothetical protein KME57_17310 [Scytonema hyalinum WJT4-NPBG1]|nr:hypothetical protein [Scytonema hyalinum WJT4-NPBG1]
MSITRWVLEASSQVGKLLGDAPRGSRLFGDRGTPARSDRDSVPSLSSASQQGVQP